MASDSVSSHSFQKLKINTSASPKPVSSSFASISRDDLSQTAHNGDAQSHNAHDHAVSAPHKISSGEPYPRPQHGSNGHRLPYDLAVGSIGSEDDGFDMGRFRQRTTSISFDNQVHLDTGDTLALEVPIPKPLSSRQSRTPESGSYSDHEYLEMPYHKRLSLHHRVGVSRYPLLQTNVNDLAKNPEFVDQVASLTSDTTASPPLEEARTPLEPPSDFMLSPHPTTSPMEFPGCSARRVTPGVPNGTRSFRSDIGEDGSLRRASRRSSNRSGRSLSSMSPAASFLARYKATEAPIKPSEPDDEGQGIGYNSEYIIGKKIGYGGFSIVKEVTSIEDGEPVVHAVKILRRQLRDKSEFENEQIQSQFDHEVEIWRFLRHAYILPLLCVYTTDFATFCITRLNKGGTLFDLMRDTRRKKKAGLPKHLVQRYAYQLASALRYLHNDVQVVHRDVKLENCLVDMTVPNAETDGGDVLLCDFGMADFIVSDQRDGPEPQSSGENPNIGPADTSTSVAGSLQYAAPELFNATGSVFSTAADMWAYGVVLFALLTASLPFNEGLDIKTAAKIREGTYDEELVRNSEAVQEGGIEDVLTLVKGCLDLDPERRWTVHEVLDCNWLRHCEGQYENVSRSWLSEI